MTFHSDQSAPNAAQTKTSEPDASAADDDDEYERASVSPGLKIDLVCGAGAKFAQTIVLDAEPCPPDKFHGQAWPGNVGDYIKVKGGKHTPGHPTSKLLLKLKTGWADQMMWKKWNKKSSYENWPGVLSSNYDMFTKDMGTKDLMQLPDFLVDMQHVQNTTPKPRPARVSPPPPAHKAVKPTKAVAVAAKPAAGEPTSVRPRAAAPRRRRQR